MKEKLYTSGQVADILGIPIRRVFSFTRAGYVKPTKATGKGIGKEQFWSERDLILLNLTVYLIDVVGLEGAPVRQYVNLLAKDSKFPNGYRDNGFNYVVSRSKEKHPLAWVALNVPMIIADTMNKVRAWEGGPGA